MKQQHAWNIFIHNQKLIEMADKKAGYVFVICSLITTYLLSNLANLKSANSWIVYVIVLLLIINAITLILILAIFFARFAKHTGESPPKLVYFNDITKRKLATDYIKTFINSNEESILEDILYQVYETSQICKSKFKLLNLAMILMSFAVLIFFSIIIISSL